MLTTLVYNIVCVCVFAALANAFGKWWIALFAIVFILLNGVYYVEKDDDEEDGKENK